MPTEPRPAGPRTHAPIVLALAAALAAGLLAGFPWQALALAALALVAWLARERQRMLEQRERERRQSRVGKRRLVGMLRAYRALADALPDAVIVAERDSQRITWFNAAANRLLGLHYPEDVDAPLGERLQPLPIARWLASGRMAEPLADIASPLDPSMRLSLRLVPYSEDLWLLIARDVSRLTRLEEMRRDFVANVSHELRTPLTVVHGYLDMLDPTDHPEWAPMVAEMQRQSQRMTQLVEDLLMLSRLESQDSLPAEEPVSIAPMLGTLRREAMALSQGRHEVSVEDDAGVDLFGSNKELHSAFSNLVSNAVRYTPAGGTITVRFRREGRGVALEVVDSGYGIPASHLPRLTERFYRVSNSRSRESGGTGLGLAIVKHVLNLHQAHLEVSSEVGQGSTFACVFGPERVRQREPSEVPS